MKMNRFCVMMLAAMSAVLCCSCGKSPSETVVSYFDEWRNQEGSDVKTEMYDQIEAKVQVAVIKEFGEKQEGDDEDEKLQQEIAEYSAEIRNAEKKKLDAMTDTDFTTLALQRRNQMQGCQATVKNERIVKSSQGEKAEVDFTVTYARQGSSRRVTENGYADLIRNAKGKWQIATLDFGYRPGTEPEESDNAEENSED